MPDENKIQMYSSYIFKFESSTNLDLANQYINNINGIINFLDHSTDFSAEDDALFQKYLKSIEHLRIELRTRTLKYIK